MEFKELCSLVSIKYLNDDLRPSGQEWLKMAYNELDPEIKSLEKKIAELEKENKELTPLQPTIRNMVNSHADNLKDQKTIITLRKALEFYANEFSVMEECGSMSCGMSMDYHVKAQTALKEIGK